MHRLRDLGAQVPGAPEEVVDSRVPPHDLDAEGAVLSAVMVDPSAFAKVKDFLLPEHFYSEAHRRIFEACVEMTSKDKPIDIIQVATWLRDHDRLKQVGGMAYMTEVLNSAPAVANVRAYAKTVYEKWRVRKFIHACQEATATGYVGYGEAQPFMERYLAIFENIVWVDRPAGRHDAVKSSGDAGGNEGR